MNKGGAFVLGIFALFGLAALLISKGSSGNSRPYRRAANEWVRQMPEEPTARYTVQEEPRPAASTYVNEEKWHIEWNQEGLPTDITIKRKAQRA